MNKIHFSPSRAGIAALILWVLFSFVSITPLTATLFLMLVAIVGFWPSRNAQKSVQSQKTQTLGAEIDNGPIKVTWGWDDYVGVALLIVVIAAVVEGANPLDVLKSFSSLK